MFQKWITPPVIVPLLLMICSASARKIGVVAAASGATGALGVIDEAVVVALDALDVEAGSLVATAGEAATFSAFCVSLSPEEKASEANKLPTPTRAKAMPSLMAVNARKELRPATRSKTFGLEKRTRQEC
jgi:hypothetical protein